MNTIDAIKNRHSYRGKYTGAKVPREDLVTILEAGLMLSWVIRAAGLKREHGSILLTVNNCRENYILG